MTPNQKRVVIPVVVVAIAVPIWFGVRWLQGPKWIDVPLRPTLAMIQKEADELKARVDHLNTQMNSEIVGLTDRALEDDYLSISEEQDIVARAVAAAESLKANASCEATISGFVFHHEASGQVIKVAGFSFNSQDARGMMDAEVQKKPAAVKESFLVERFRSLLTQHTKAERSLDDTKRSFLLRTITSPDVGKKKGLNPAVAEKVLEEYCATNGIRLGPEPNGERATR